MARLIRLKELSRKVGLSPATIWRLEKQDRFPKRKKVGTYSVAWLESEIDAWIEGLSVPAKEGA